MKSTYVEHETKYHINFGSLTFLWFHLAVKGSIVSIESKGRFSGSKRMR